jgi:undecaprenyl-diphosphatase
VRRPRPRAYLARDRAEREGREFEETKSDEALSFYSGHTAITAGLTATATYMAFVRGDDELEGWLTLAGGTLLTGLVGWQRVSVRAHFPTDVIAGAMAGAGVGVLVPHLHRVEPGTRTQVQVGLFQDGDGTQGLSLFGHF